MAEFPVLLVKDMLPPPDAIIPRAAWLDVVDQLGELVLARPVTRTGCGKITISFCFNDQAMERIKTILRRYAGEPWATDPFDGADPDAWKDE